MFTHDGHPMLVEHVRNARRHEGQFGITVRKEVADVSPQDRRACVCMIPARGWCGVRYVSLGYGKEIRSGRAFFLLIGGDCGVEKTSRS